MGKRPIDDVDLRILDVLVRDGRISVNELAHQANVSRATAYNRFERLRRDGIVRGFHAIVDTRALGYNATAIVLVNLAQGEWPAALRELSALPGVEYVALTSGAFDVVLVVRVRSVEDLRDVLLVRMHRLPHVRSTQTAFVLDEHRPSLSPWAGETSGNH
jgi:DNA-binding Lrp family transcriptional regulator